MEWAMIESIGRFSLEFNFDIFVSDFPEFWLKNKPDLVDEE